MKTTLNQVFQPYQVNTGIVNPPTLLTRVLSVEQITSFIHHKRPQILLFALDKHDQVKHIGSIDYFLSLCQNQFILALETDDIKTAKRFVRKMNELGIIDFFIVSKDRHLLTSTRKTNGFSRFILKVDDVSAFVDANDYFPFNIWLPAHVIDKSLVESLQTKTLTVFTEVHTIKERENALLSGVNGIVTSEPLTLIKRYESFKSLTHIREVSFVAHRGLHLGYQDSIGPENSLESALNVKAHGAKIIEIDIHLSIDNEVMVIHDEKTHRVSREKHIIAKTTSEILQTVKLNKLDKHSPSHIHTLSDFLRHFKDDDTRFLIETKPISKELIEQTMNILNQLDMTHRVSFISFSIKNIGWQNTLTPLRSGYLFKPVKEDTLAMVLGLISSQHATFNPFYKGLTQAIVTSFFHRAIPLWPWTVDALDEITAVYHLGVNGITTNQFDTIKDCFIQLEVPTHYTYQDQPITIHPMLKSLSGLTKSAKGKLHLIDDGGTNIVFKDTTVLGAKEKGKALFVLVVKVELGTTHFYKTSPLIEVDVV